MKITLVKYIYQKKHGIVTPKLNASLNDKRALSAEEFGRIVAVLNIDVNELLQIN